MKVAEVIIVAAALAAGGSLLWAFAEKQGHAADVEKLFGGAAGLAALQSPDRVEAFRLQHIPLSGKPPEVVGDPVAVPKPLSAELSAVLSSPDSYGWDYAKGCIPNYGVQLSFYRGDDRLDVLLCFECNELLVTWKGAHIGGEDFDAIRPQLVRAVKALFPNDAVIQGLKADN